jgi:hypothetical protein
MKTTAGPDWQQLQRQALSRPRVRASGAVDGQMVRLPDGVYVAVTVNK